MRFILSTVGTSIFRQSLQRSESCWQERLTKVANEPELDDELAQKVDELAERVLTALRENDVRRNRRLSAELNGLYGIYSGNFAAGRGDEHYLIATDTALGRKAAEVIRTFLEEQGLTVSIYVPEGLSMADASRFSEGMKALIGWCEEVVPGYRHKGYQVIFNLTGAFKSLQGYLNIVGMFYADEIVYIFESGTELLTIPRLPLQIDRKALRNHRVELAMMAQRHTFRVKEVADVPEGLLEVTEVSGEKMAGLSSWGALVWNRVRQELLGDDLVPFPGLRYSDNFRRDFGRASPPERVQLQETLAKVSSLLVDRGGDTAALRQDHGLRYDKYVGKTTADGRPIAHFRVSRSRRVSCVAEGGELVLRRYGEHSINENP